MEIFRRQQSKAVELDSDGSDSSSASSYSSDTSPEAGSSLMSGSPRTSQLNRSGVFASQPPLTAFHQRSLSHSQSRGSFVSGAGSPVASAASKQGQLSISSPSHTFLDRAVTTTTPTATAAAHLSGSFRGNASGAFVPAGYVGMPAIASPRSLNASMAFSQYMATAMEEMRPTMNLLVLGAPQVGKSLFINAYRSAVTNNTKWPSAPVGICGFYGTTSVDPFPNHPTEPTWLCIDTPGKFYDAEDEAVLEKLVEGMPWKTKLVGKKAMSLADIENLTPIGANRAHACIIVIPANDLIEDMGWSNLMRWRNRYEPASDAEGVVLYTKGLVSSLRALMNDAAPFVIITKMDKVGGAGNTAARQAITALVGQCAPSNHIFFVAFSEDRSSLAMRRQMDLDPATRQELLRLHENVCFAVQWTNRVKEM